MGFYVMGGCDGDGDGNGNGAMAQQQKWWLVGLQGSGVGDVCDGYCMQIHLE